MNQPHPLKGFTLIELLIVMTILAIVAGTAIPGLNELWKNGNRHAAINDLVTLINLARNTAIQENTTVTLCPLNSSDQCVADWSLPIVAFRDPERDKRVNSNSQLLRMIPPPSSGHLVVRSANRPYFQFQPTGMARYAIGNIVWCPSDNNNQSAAQIRINMGGRPLLSKDQDGDGIVEGSDGRPVTCSR